MYQYKCVESRRHNLPPWSLANLSGWLGVFGVFAFLFAVLNLFHVWHGSTQSVSYIQQWFGKPSYTTIPQNSKSVLQDSTCCWVTNHTNTKTPTKTRKVTTDRVAKRIKNESQKRANPSCPLPLPVWSTIYRIPNCLRCSTTSAPQTNSNSKPCDLSKVELGRCQKTMSDRLQKRKKKQKLDKNTDKLSKKNDIHNRATRTAVSRTLPRHAHCTFLFLLDLCCAHHHDSGSHCTKE